MVKIANKIINEMGYPIKVAKNKLDSLDDTIVNHLIKLYCFGRNHRKQDVGTWVSELIEYANILTLKNKPKKPRKKPNLSRKYFEDVLKNNALEDLSDIELRLTFLQKEGYPAVIFKNSDLKKLQKLADKFIDLVFEPTKTLTITQNDLGDM